MIRAKPVLTIIKKEYLSAIRERTLLLVACITGLLIAFSAVTGWLHLKKNDMQKQRAATLFREEWEEQDTNPHSAAHFGTYLFKPGSLLSMYDNGLNTYLGNSYRVEAHIQHEVNQSEAEASDSQLRFGELSLALVFQLLVPLLILLITFNSITREREGNVLRVILMQGIKPAEIIWGKILGIYSIVLSVIIPALLLMVIPILYQTPDTDILVRFSLFSITYLLFFFIVVCIGITVSALNKTSNGALVTALGCWLIWAVLMPRAVARIIDTRDVLPSRYELSRNITRGNQQGMGNDGSSLERHKKYIAETLKKYGVDSISQLPVNLDGLSMQYGEDYNTKVYERYAGNVESIIKKQQLHVEQFSLLNPFMAVQQFSMGIAGTDYFHHLNFHHQAKDYRDDFVRTLNMDLANSGSKYLSYSYKVGPEFFKKMKDFNYVAPTFAKAIQWHSYAIASLFLWTTLLITMIPFVAKRLKQ
jgi:ABC-2 type transport system permease protein